MTEITYLYRYYNEDDVLLYVGISKDHIRRAAEHGTYSIWFKDVTTIKIYKYPSRKLALEAENEAIMKERPLHNRNSPSGRTIQFATRITPEYDAKIRAMAARDGLNLCTLV